MRRLLFCILLIASSMSACLASGGKRIVFIGDSITDGNWGCVYNYRKTSAERSQTDMNHIYGHSYVLFVAARCEAARPEADLEFFNRGFSGHHLRDLAARWQEDVLDLNPDVLSVLVGINDIPELLEHGNYEQWTATLRSLLQQVKDQNPGVKLVLCTPFTTKPEWAEGVARLDEIVRSLCKEFGAVCVPFDTMFAKLVRKAPNSGFWIWDGIHPTPAGHLKMAELWMKKTRLRF